MESLTPPSGEQAHITPTIDLSQPPEVRIAAERDAAIADTVNAVAAYTQTIEVPENDRVRDHQAQRARNFLLEHDMKNTIILASQKPDDLNTLLTVTDKLEEKLGSSLSGDFLDAALFDREGQSFQELIAREDLPLGRILTRLVNDPDQEAYSYEKNLRLVEKIVRNKYGSMVYWAGNKAIPPFLQKLTESDRFGQQCLSSAARTLQTPELAQDAEKQRHAARRFEYFYLKDVLGLTPELTDEIRMAIQGRTMKQDNKTGQILEMAKGGGVDVALWEKTLDKLSYNIAELTVPMAMNLREEFEIINFDRYHVEQLKRMKMIWQSAQPELMGIVAGKEDQALPEEERQRIEQLMALLKNGDVAFVGAAAFGDYNNAHHNMERLDNRGMAVFSEITSATPAGFYRRLVTMAVKYGIKPSTLVVGAHGLAGGMVFPTPDAVIQLGVPLNENRENEIQVGIKATRIGKMINKFMKPHSKTGHKYVFLMSCHQAELTKSGETSAEAVLKASYWKDRVVVTATKEAAAWTLRRGGLTADIMGDDTDTFVMDWVQIYSRNALGMIRRRKQRFVEGIRS